MYTQFRFIFLFKSFFSLLFVPTKRSKRLGTEFRNSLQAPAHELQATSFVRFSLVVIILTCQIREWGNSLYTHIHHRDKHRSNTPHSIPDLTLIITVSQTVPSFWELLLLVETANKSNIKTMKKSCPPWQGGRATKLRRGIKDWQTQPLH